MQARMHACMHTLTHTHARAETHTQKHTHTHKEEHGVAGQQRGGAEEDDMVAEVFTVKR